MADIDAHSRPVRGRTAQRLWPAGIALARTGRAGSIPASALAAGLRGKDHYLLPARLRDGPAGDRRRLRRRSVVRPTGETGCDPLGWSVIGAAVVVAGLSMGHAHLTGWGVMLAAVIAGVAAGLPLAAARS